MTMGADLENPETWLRAFLSASEGDTGRLTALIRAGPNVAEEDVSLHLEKMMETIDAAKAHE